MLNDWNRVSVIEGRFSPKSKCSLKSCKSIAKFMVFNDDGAPKMSRLFSCCCAKHLPVAIRRAWKENTSRAEKLEKQKKLQAKKEAKKLLGLSK